MIKKITVIAAVCLIAATIFSAPKFIDIRKDALLIEQLDNRAGKMKNSLSLIDKELSGYREKYKGIKLQSNLDIATSVSKLAGSKFVSVTSVVEMDGEEINCSEVTNVEDVSFFGSQTKKMRFKLQIQNFDEFRKSLQASAIAVDELEYSNKDRVAYVVINTVLEGVAVPTEGGA